MTASEDRGQQGSLACSLGFTGCERTELERIEELLAVRMKDATKRHRPLWASQRRQLSSRKPTRLMHISPQLPACSTIGIRCFPMKSS